MKDWNAESLLGLARGFMEPRVLLSAIELNVFSTLAGPSLTASELAGRIGAKVRPLEMLLDALVSMDLLVKTEGRYHCPSDVARYLSDDGEETVAPLALHAANLWQTWSQLSEITWAPDAHRRNNSDWLSAFIGAMHVVATPIADKLVGVVGPRGDERLIDVGGASGTYALAFLRACPNMTATIFDRPGVIPMAESRAKQAGVMDRLTLVPGDFTVDPLPAGHDLAFVSAIIHSFSLEGNVQLFKNVFDSLKPGGRIVVRDHIMSPDRTHPKSGALFALNMLVGTEGGGTYTQAEIEGAMKQAGFERVRLVQPDEAMNGLIEAFRPV